MDTSECVIAAVPNPATHANGRHEPAEHVLFPLDEFYLAAGRVIPEAEVIAGEAMPEPYRSLLVHSRDMTPTLEAFHGERIHLRVLERRVEGDRMMRCVALTTDETERPVEFGAIVIHCAEFPPDAQTVVMECHTPLGTILRDFRIEHTSRPEAFLRVASDGLIGEALGLAQPQELYGRRNVLWSEDGKVLAEVLEILPPAGK